MNFFEADEIYEKDGYVIHVFKHPSIDLLKALSHHAKIFHSRFEYDHNNSVAYLYIKKK